MVNPIIGVIGAVLFAVFAGTAVFGPIAFFPILVGSFLIVAVLQWLTKMPLLPISAPKVPMAVLALAGIGLVVGTFTTFGISLGGLLGPSATLTGSTVTTPSGQQVIVDTRQGVASTVTVYAEDRENNVPTTRTTSALIRSYVGDVLTTTFGSTTSSNGGTVAGAKKGDTVKFYGGNATWYVDYATAANIAESVNIVVPVHAATTVGNLVVTCYDSSGTVLSGGGDTNEEDYDITLAANQEVQFSCQISPSTADTAFNLGAIATAAFNDISKVEPLAFNKVTCQAGHAQCNAAGSVALVEKTMPLALANAQIWNGTAQAAGEQIPNVTGYDKFYEFQAPILLQEFDEFRYNFKIVAGATNPATADWLTPTSQDMGVICFFDAIWDRGTDGTERLSAYTRDTSENIVGVLEDFYQPQGLDACATIEGL